MGWFVYLWLNISLWANYVRLPPSSTKMTFKLFKSLPEISSCASDQQNNIFKLFSCQSLSMVAKILLVKRNASEIHFVQQDEWLCRLKGGSNVHRDAVGVVSSLAMLIAFSVLLLLLSAARPRVVLEIRVFEQEWWLHTDTDTHNFVVLKKNPLVVIVP